MQARLRRFFSRLQLYVTHRALTRREKQFEQQCRAANERCVRLAAKYKRLADQQARDHAEQQQTLEDYRQEIMRIDRDRHDAVATVDNLRLTLRENERYISEIESSLKTKDTEIGLLRLEVETLTLWREKINQQLRTEADIEAAKSKAFIGTSRQAERILEHLKDADTNKRG